MNDHRLALIVLALLGCLVSCGGTRGAAPRNVGLAPRIGTTILESAHVNASETIRSCVGPSLCREDALTTADAAALADVEDACNRHGGTFAPLRCTRDRALGKCSASSEHGTVTVFAYDGSADDLVSKQCEMFEGAFEKLTAQVP